MGNGNHAFSYTVNWDSLEGTSFIVEGYVETASGKNRIYGSPQYSKKETAGVKASQGPAGDKSARYRPHRKLERRELISVNSRQLHIVTVPSVVRAAIS